MTREKLKTIIKLCQELLAELPPLEEPQPLQGEILVSVHEIQQTDTFLDEINKPVPLAADEPEQTPELPNLENVEALKERFELEAEKEPDVIQRDSKEFLALLEFSMFKGWQKLHVDNFLIGKGLKLTAKDEEHLQEMRYFAALVKKDEMDVTTLLSQNCLTDAERSLLTGKYIF